jgi:hypothetical protein
VKKVIGIAPDHHLEELIRLALVQGDKLMDPGSGSFDGIGQEFMNETSCFLLGKLLY